jgi:hypothetical protein
MSARNLAVLLALLLPSAPVAAQGAVATAPAAAPAAAPAPLIPPDVVEAIRREGIDNSKVMQHLDYLTNRIGHRLTGSDNFTEACEWARAEFERMGLEARLEKWGTWKHGWNREQWSGRVLTPAPMELQVATEAWTAGTPGAVRGPLLAMPTTDEEIAGRRAALRGAFLFDMASVPSYEERQEERGRRGREGGSPLAKLRDQAAELGIAGFVRSSAGTPQLKNRIRVFGDSRRARQDAANLPTVPEIVVRYDQALQLRDALQRGDELTVEFDIRNRFSPGPVDLHNVIAEIKGTVKPDEYVVVSSHLDSWHQATGTTDNGTGSATTMEAARILAAVGARPHRTIQFCLWGGEEQGLLGSRQHVQMERANMPKVSAVFNHDTGTNYAAGVDVTAAMKDDMERVFAPVRTLTPPDEKHEGPAFELRVVEGLRGGGSDHASFLSADVPGLNWSLKGRSDYFNYTWHTQWDTYDVAIPEYQRHTATVIAYAALGTANLPNLVSREKLRAPGGRGDAGALLEGVLGAEFDGLKVKSVTKDGRLAAAGIQVGDELKAVNDEEIERIVQVLFAARQAAGEPVTLSFARGGAKVKATIPADAFPQRGRRGDGPRGDAPAAATPPAGTPPAPTAPASGGGTAPAKEAGETPKVIR